MKIVKNGVQELEEGAKEVHRNLRRLQSSLLDPSICGFCQYKLLCMVDQESTSDYFNTIQVILST